MFRLFATLLRQWVKATKCGDNLAAELIFDRITRLVRDNPDAFTSWAKAFDVVDPMSAIRR